MCLADVRARHVVDMFHKVRTDRERNLAQRTIHNIHTVVSAMFRGAKLADLIEQSPCILDERVLGRSTSSSGYVVVPTAFSTRPYRDLIPTSVPTFPWRRGAPG